MPDAKTTAKRLTELYETDNPQMVGSIDGTEDDFGDLIHEIVTDYIGDLGDDDENVQDSAWDTAQEKASNCGTTNMVHFVREVGQAARAEAIEYIDNKQGED